MSISENYKKIRSEIPNYVTIVAASKTRTSRGISDLIDAGCTDIGENYVQEAQEKYSELSEDAKKLRWHLMGHLQRNKVKSALEIFDVIQTIDSLKLAEEIGLGSRDYELINVKIDVDKK